MTLLPIIIATVLISLISLVGVILIFNKKERPEFLTSLVSLAAGSLLAVSLLDLLPEAVAESSFEPRLIFGTVLLSMLFFFLFERVLHWHHCYDQYHHHYHPAETQKKHLIYFNLLGDSVHNLIDGFLVAGAFMLNWQTGLTVALAVVLHEIPQEIADFGVLLYAGLTKIKAIFYNLLVAAVAIAGAIIFYFFGTTFELLIPIMAAFSAGNFLYLATADLIPELHHETNPQKVIAHSVWLVVGIIIIFLASRLLPH